MSKKKIIVIVGIVLVAGLAIWGTISYSSKNVVAVQTGKVAREDLASVVTASGEIKPKNYVNVGANAFGKIVKLYVKEGDHVKKGQMLAQLENVQSASDVAAMRASLDAARTDAVAADAGLKTAQAQVEQSQAQLEQAKLDYDRAQGLYKDALIAKSDYDAKKAAYDAGVAGLAQSKARVAQAKAQLDSSHGRVTQTQANLVKSSDLLSKTEYLAPYDGVITNLPVREGETVVIGIQNAPGSTLMTLADLSIITAEVKVDETDIVNVKLGQTATVSIDAIPNKTFQGTVTEIGDNAIVRSTGVSTSQTTGGSQEAKDFKVVVTLSDPPENLRPGLSTTAKITTATRQGALAVPIQALTIRRSSELKEASKNSVQAAAPAKPEDKKADEELQGVFVVRNKRAVFVPVQTGITGTTDIEVTSGLKEGDVIVTGSYKVLRTLRNNAAVTVEKTPAPTESS
ncbi:MAG TPA: efflux RND transporter periplasmic adaptor subunit [Terriglobales bacterium]|jgi:HlyD family secretion protein|nr:efflux RND transporter periplasmic adaptor subunit [Terriglobales bacterium]